MSTLRFLLNVNNSRFLLYNSSVNVLEQLPELNHLFLDLLDGLVPALNGAQCGLRFASAVAL